MVGREAATATENAMQDDRAGDLHQGCQGSHSWGEREEAPEELKGRPRAGSSGWTG